MAELAYQPFSAARHVDRAWPGGHAKVALRKLRLLVDADDELQRLDRHPLLGELVLDVCGSHRAAAQIQAPLQELIPQDNAIAGHRYVCRRRIAAYALASGRSDQRKGANRIGTLLFIGNDLPSWMGIASCSGHRSILLRRQVEVNGVLAAGDFGP